MKIPLILFIVLLGNTLMAQDVREGSYVMTVNGKIAPDALGRTLVHEHIFTNFQGTDQANEPIPNQDEAISEVLPYLRYLWEMGYNTLIECTPSFIGKDVEMLRVLSERSGLQIITNTGFYAAVDKKYLPPQVYIKSAEELAVEWEEEWQNGIGQSGIRPGFIKLGVGGKALDSIEQKMVRAGMLLSTRSGLPLYVHTGGDESILSQYELAREMDFNPNRLVWVHAQNGTDETRLAMACQGIWVSLDGVNEKDLGRYITMIDTFREAGLLHRLLISHDDGWSVEHDVNHFQLKPFGNGNTRPYRTIEELLIPELERQGFTRNEINMLMVQNPRTVLTISR